VIVLFRMKKTSEGQERLSVQTVEFPNTEQTISKKSHKVWWLSGAAVIAVVLVGYGGYKYYINGQFNHFKQAGDVALRLRDYTIAEKNYTAALKFKSDLEVQSQLELSQMLFTSSNKFKEGQQQFQDGHYEQAYADLKQVSSQDSTDYSSAQKLMSEAQTELLATKVIGDLTTWESDTSTWNSDINAAVNPSNALMHDILGTPQYDSDLNSLQSINGKFTADISSLQKDAADVNTDAQLIPSPQVKDIVSNLEKAMNSYETDMNNMSASLNDEITAAQQSEQAYQNGQYGSYNLSSATPQWNAAISDTQTQDTIISDDFAKLKAYQSNGIIQNNGL
jgi:roadblock/LC7 domain-containing protein